MRHSYFSAFARISWLIIMVFDNWSVLYFLPGWEVQTQDETDLR